jgi:ADP-ribose pyrophosphatase YjhB (NUDIX family)
MRPSETITTLPGIPYIPYPIAFRTADIFPFYVDHDHPDSEPMFLVGRKHKEKKYRLIGGFVDPTDPTAEHGAYRELGEEGNAFIGPFKYKPFLPNPFRITKVSEYFEQLNQLHYMGAPKIMDNRYSDTLHGICSNVYIVMVDKITIDQYAPGDDIGEIKWLPLSEVKKMDNFETVHHGIIQLILDNCGL